MNIGKKAVSTMSKKIKTKIKIKAIGLIVEDESAFKSFKILISRILNKENITFKKQIGNGCGKMRRKAVSYADNLHRRGCDLVILIHDLDRNNLKTLETNLNNLIKKSKAKNKFICIPIEEKFEKPQSA